MYCCVDAYFDSAHTGLIHLSTKYASLDPGHPIMVVSPCLLRLLRAIDYPRIDNFKLECKRDDIILGKV